MGSKSTQRTISTTLRENERDTKVAIRELERAEKAWAKEQEKAAKAAEKERAQQYLDSRINHVETLNKQLDQEIDLFNSLLVKSLGNDPYIDLELLKTNPEMPTFVIPSNLSNPAKKPDLATYMPAKPSGLMRLIPGTQKKYEQQCEAAKKEFAQKFAEYETKEAKRLKDIEEAEKAHQAKWDAIIQEAKERNEQIDKLIIAFANNSPTTVSDYFSRVLKESEYPAGFPKTAKVAYVSESKQLVIEYDLPKFDIVPEIGQYKYIKSKDEVSSTARTMAQRKSIYASIIAQIAIRTIYEIFTADRDGRIDVVVFNGYVDAIDKATGRSVRPCLVTVRTSRDTFTELDLRRVEPAACLKFLSASVSKSPDELAPVRPVVEFNMVDPRFVEEEDVLSTLDQRPNLMELTPNEFESLITNLFSQMGLETKQTQASRDGGVDCVAYDPRPIFGGKVIIQAKRYKNTVGVSAVRDLFGTLQNEGASKGILVTTSGYGKAAFEFAEGKPLELLSGSHLLHLLAEHAGIEAKIHIPEDWKDVGMDVEGI